MTSGPTVLVVAGESSGEQHAADFCRALQHRAPGVRIMAVGGDAMRAVGAEIIADVSNLAVVGISEVAARLPRFIALKRRLTRLLKSGDIDLFIPVDFPDFNFRLGPVARRAGVPVFYYIAPQAWAWREGRARAMSHWCNHLGVIFPFEEPFFTERGVPTTFVGHPSLSSLTGTSTPVAVRRTLRVPDGHRLVALFPGSRDSELTRHLPIQVEAARRLVQTSPDVHVVIGRAATLSAERVRALAGGIPVVDPPAFDLMRAADVAITASGTATVEVALADTPMVVMYRVSGLTWQVARRLVRTPHIAMVNLIAGERLVPEYIQGEATPAAIADGALRLLDDAEARVIVRAGYARVREALAGGAGLDTAADLALSSVSTTHHG